MKVYDRTRKKMCGSGGVGCTIYVARAGASGSGIHLNTDWAEARDCLFLIPLWNLCFQDVGQYLSRGHMRSRPIILSTSGWYSIATVVPPIRDMCADDGDTVIAFVESLAVLGYCLRLVR